ncbi:MAG: LysR family transcriptional regulator [Rubrivivax sp.]|nr:LysR family transcriptional regulator [Rubrivivax sp.]
MAAKLSIEAMGVLDAVARHASFTKAAAELHKVPSAVSYTVAQVESVLGVQVFDRSQRRVRLTPIGTELLADGRRLLHMAHDIERRLGQRKAGWEATLRVSIDTIFGLQAIFPLLAEWDALGTGTRLSLSEEALGGTWDALRSDRSDIVVAGLGAGGVPSGGGYAIHELGRLAFDFAVAPSHPLAWLAERLNEPVSEDELRSFRAISVADSSRDSTPLTAGLLPGQDTLTVSTMRDKLAAQVAGLGVGFLPRFLAKPAFQRGSLVRLRVALPRPMASFCIAHRTEGLGSAGRWLVNRMLSTPSLFEMLSASRSLGSAAKGAELPG